MNDQGFLNFILEQGEIVSADQHEWALDIIWKNFDDMDDKIDKLCAIVQEYEARTILN